MPDWREIIDRDGKAVWQTAYRILGHRADADECFQEAFLDALGIAQGTEVHHWRGLLKRLVAARAIDRLRQRTRRTLWLRLLHRSSHNAGSPSASQFLEDGELSDELRRALLSLPRKQAEIFWLHSVEGMTYEEIGAQFSMTANAVGVALCRARARLAKSLTGEADTPVYPAEHQATRAKPVQLRKELP